MNAAENQGATMRIPGTAAGVLALAMATQGLAAQQPSGGRHPDMPQMTQHTQTMDSMNVRLDTLVARMNRMTGNQKIAAMADVINELVAQRHGMQQQMRRMMEMRRSSLRSPSPATGAAPER